MGTGDSDILSASQHDNKVAWYENNILAVTPIPQITLTINPTSVTEDGSTNLTYTFTRTEDPTNPLTVNFSVAGDATFDDDYTQSGATSFNSTEGSITFEAGFDTATLTIDPTADTDYESDETVALTLVAGTDYTVSSTDPVTGTILNDDTESTIHPDFNMDGKRDLVWYNQSTGVNAVWYMDGANLIGEDELSILVNTDWEIVGTGDANNDQKTDLYWRNQATGRNVVWYMDGVSRTGFDELSTVANTDWEIVGIGDADEDSLIDDIYWRNQATGQNVVWYMDGTTMTSSDNLPTVTNLDWQIVGIADGNGDGNTDLYWRNQVTGKNVLWYMDGVNRTGADTLPQVANIDWQIVGTGDGNGDGNTDIYWRNQVTGQNVLWYMNGANRTGFDVLPALTDSNWTIVA